MLVQKYQQVQSTLNRVKENIVFRDGEWDTSAYNADSSLPSSSSIYVLASDGFVLERWRPIAGFLDASDFKHLLAFSEIQTLRTSTQQHWRMYSLPLQKDGEVWGVVTVSSYHPLPELIGTFDAPLQAAAATVASHVVLENGRVEVKNFDERRIPHYISYQVVNRFNKIVLKGSNNNSIDRLPNFIDPSYVSQQLERFSIQFIRDQRNGSWFLVSSQPLLDERGAPKGVIVIGESLQSLFDAWSTYSIVLAGVSLLGFFALVLRHKILSHGQKSSQPVLRFDAKDSSIWIDHTRVPLTYASNQYYLCQAIFQKKDKRWEADELLEKFGEEPRKDSWRKIYDAMNQVNKKVFPLLGKKLIVLEGKTYRLHPELL